MSAHVSGGRRTIVAMAVVAVLCLAAGVLLSRLIVSPGAAAAEAAPPTAGPITVPVERRTIGNEVVLRGDVGYDDPVELRVETGDLGGPAVVTGQVKEVGATLEAGAVALEVVGRPVVVLPGELPTYRTLRVGVSGPDVQQLRTALQAMGIDGGDPGNATYDASAAAGVRALYQRVGYEPPSAGEEATEAVTAAREGLTTAQEALRSAQAQLAGAGTAAGPGASLAELDGAIRVAEARAAFLGSQCALPLEARDPSAADCSPPALVEADAALQTARAARAAADKAPDTSLERSAVRAAQDQVAAARTALQQAEADTLTPLPATEVVYLPSLPRRVDDVEVRRGGTVSGAFMTVSGATVQVTASASKADADLLTPGTAGTIPLEDGEVPVTVAEVTDAEPAGTADGESAQGGGEESARPTGDRRRVVFTVGALTPEQLTALQGTNVRVRVPVSSTEGEVLAVPLAALTAGPGGESRLEVADGEGASRLVEVTTGLAAGGYVEITGSKEPVEEGDLVVVGAAGAETSDEDDAEPGADATEEG
ncbi:hypothetical protein AB6N23_04965 [Cellulomonas sp. 179-A 9B4 NHS]|uniref:hypothetical protein n=1 Tax=Cellulomonas sp. 179-A 9B4 NHS TaxID=3142379 RepID=UPI0039A27A2E